MLSLAFVLVLTHCIFNIYAHKFLMIHLVSHLYFEVEHQHVLMMLHQRYTIFILLLYLPKIVE